MVNYLIVVVIALAMAVIASIYFQVIQEKKTKRVEELIIKTDNMCMALSAKIIELEAAQKESAETILAYTDTRIEEVFGDQMKQEQAEAGKTRGWYG